MAKKRTGPTWWKMFNHRCKKNVETTKRTNRPPIPSLTTPIGCLTEEKRREEKQEDKKRKEGAGGKERKRNICRGVGRYFDVIMFLFAKTSAALDALSDKIVCCPPQKMRICPLFAMCPHWTRQPRRAVWNTNRNLRRKRR